MALAPEREIKEYHRPIPATWWLKRPAYLRFMIREATGAFIALYAILLFKFMHRAAYPAGFQQLVDWVRSPAGMVFHGAVLVFALFHSVTFFGLTPKVLKMRRGEESVPELAIIGFHYGAWLVASAVLLIVALRAG